MADLIHKDLSYKLNGIFFEVQNKLGTQFQEKHYQKAISLLLEKNSIPFEAEVPIEVKFEGKTLGRFKADIVVDKKILLELKTADKLTLEHKQQLIRYLHAGNLRLALLVNFRKRPLQVWRIVN